MEAKNNIGFISGKIDNINKGKELLNTMPSVQAYIDKKNNESMNNNASNTDYRDLDPKYGALVPFVDQATKILDSVYASTSEPTQREKDINMGRAALKFFTTLGAKSSIPGATALGAANQAGALVAQDYINAETKKESDAKKLAQAKKSSALSLGMQLKSADDAKEIALGKKKTKYVPLYKDGSVTNVIENSDDYIKKITEDDWKLTKPDKLTTKSSKIYKNTSEEDIVLGDFTFESGKETRLSEDKLALINPELSGKIVEVKIEEKSRPERDRKKLISYGFNYKNLSPEKKAEYFILYQQAVDGKPTQVEEDGKVVTKMLGGLDLRFLKDLPVPEGFDVSRAINQKNRVFKPDQIKSAGFGIRLFQNDGVVNQLMKNGYRPNFSDLFKNAKSINAGLGTTLLDTDAQLYFASTSNFISALLRQESGAAIGEGEYIRRINEIFPQFGDSAETIQKKKQARETEITGFVKAGGDAFTNFYPDAVQFLKTKIGDKSFNKLNSIGYAQYLNQRVLETDGIIYEETIKDKTIEEIKRMLGASDARQKLADYQIDVLTRVLDAKLLGESP
jgi:hypothetical protein